MEFREIVRLVDSAEKGLYLLEDHAAFYGQCLDDYLHSEDSSSELDEGRYVSEHMLRDMTSKTVVVVPEFQETVKCLETLKEEVTDYTGYRYVNGNRIEPNEIESRVQDLVDEYHDVFENIWTTGYRIKQNPDLEPNPIDMRLKRWRRDSEDTKWLEEVGEVQVSDQPDLEALGQLFT